MRNSLVLLVTALVLAGCGNNVKANPADLKGKTASYSHQGGKMNFTERTLGSALGMSFAKALAGPQFSGGAGDGSAPVAPEKQAIISQYSPAAAILDGVKSQLEQNFSMKPAQGNADYTVTLEEGNWGMREKFIEFTSYTVFYSAYLQIRSTTPDAKGKTPRIFMSCSYESDTKHSYDEMYANNAAVIKGLMGEAAKKCVEDFSKQIREKAEQANKPSA